MSVKSPLANMFLSVARNGDAFGRKPLSDITVRTYEHALKQTEGLMEKPFEDWQYGDMEEFFRRAEAAGYRGTTTKTMGNVLRIMFRWATEAGIFTKPNPMRGLPQVIRQDPAPPALSPAQAQDVLDAIVSVLHEKREGASALAQRIPSMDERFVEKYVFLFELSYISGIPLKRLLKLRKADVEQQGIWETTVYGRKVKRDFVPVPKPIMERLHDYIAEHPDTDYVFYGESGLAHGGNYNQPMGSSQAYKVFQDARAQLGYDDNLTPAVWANARAAWAEAHSS